MVRGTQGPLANTLGDVTGQLTDMAIYGREYDFVQTGFAGTTGYLGGSLFGDVNVPIPRVNSGPGNASSYFDNFEVCNYNDIIDRKKVDVFVTGVRADLPVASGLSKAILAVPVSGFEQVIDQAYQQREGQ